MKKTTVLATAILFCLFFISMASAATIVVPDEIGTIQEAIDNATAGDTIIVNPGTYSEFVTVDVENVSLTANGSVTLDGTVDIEADGVTLDGFTISPSAVFTDQDAAVLVTASDVSVMNNIIEGVRGNSTSGSVSIHGVQVWSADGISNILVEDNIIRDIRNVATGANAGGAVGVKVQGAVDGVDVIDNEIEDIHSAGWTYGTVVTPTVNNLEADPQNVVIEGNDFDNINDGSVYDVFLDELAAPFPGTATAVDSMSPGVNPADASEVDINQNNFFDVPIGVMNKDDGNELNAEVNWWGDASGPSQDGPGNGSAAVGDGFLPIFGPIDFMPWLCEEARSEEVSVNGTCDVQEPPVEEPEDCSVELDIELVTEVEGTTVTAMCNANVDRDIVFDYEFQGTWHLDVSNDTLSHDFGTSGNFWVFCGGYDLTCDQWASDVERVTIPPEVPEDNETELEKVSPILECVEQVDNQTYNAYFGYLNPNDQNVTLPIGDENKFTGGGVAGQDQGQPTLFEPGRTPFFPDAEFSVEFDGSNLVWTLNGKTSTASNSSQRCVVPEEPEPQPVKPILECVEEVGNESYTAYFGYLNENNETVEIPVGDNNKFTGGGLNGSDQGQPTLFDPGRTPFFPDAEFSVEFDGSNLVWTLEGPDESRRTSTASSDSQRCEVEPEEPPVCFESVCDIPASCNGEITYDDCKFTPEEVRNNCRNVVCESGNNSLQVKACEKPDDGEKEFFEMYKESQTGTGLEVCIGDTCIGNNGFARSSDYPICIGDVPDEDPEIPEEPPEEPDVNVSAELSIAPWFPQGSDYVFVCESTGFVATSWDWNFGDGAKQVNSGNMNVWHTYGSSGEFTVSCTASDGDVSATDTLEVEVEALIE